MRNFIKKICAVITLVAMLTSLGITVFADGGASVTIDRCEWSEITNGVATITVTYTVTGDTIGALGATMLTFADADDSTTLDETAYNDTMQIVGIDQGAPKVLDGGVVVSAEADDNGAYAEGTYVFRFPVAVSSTETSAAGIQLGSGEAAAILIGGDNVVSPAAWLIEAPYIAWNVESLEWTGADSIDLGDVTVYSNEEADWLEAVAEAALDSIADDTVTAYKADDITSDIITLEGLDLTAVAVAGDGNYVVTVTVPEGTATDNADSVGGILAEEKTFEIIVTANKVVELPKWEVTGDPVLEDGTTIAVELSEEDFAAADAAKVEAVLDTVLAGKKVTLNVEKEGEEDSTVVIDVTAEMIAVTNVAADGDAKSYTGTVTIPADTYPVVGDDDTLTLEEDIVIAISGTVAEEISFIYGDADSDGEITGLDATVIKRHVAGFTENINLDAADVDGDGEVTGLDATIVMRTVAGFYDPSELPIN